MGQDVSMLSDEQQYVLVRMLRKTINPKEPKELLILDSPGGCGKTHTLRAVCNILTESMVSYVVGTYTGRASAQVAKEGIANVSTLHSLMMKALVDDEGNLIRFEDIPDAEVAENIGKVLICDESSMIPSAMYKRLKKICDDYNIQFILVGDSAQLEPIEPDKSKGFNCMDQKGEHLKLTHNFRQQEGSAVAALAMHLREENSIPMKKTDDLRMVSKAQIRKLDFHQKNHFDAIICGTHKTRRKMNDLVRQARGFYDEVADIGEIVVCKRNDVIGDRKINNGELYKVEARFESPLSECYDYMLSCLDKNLKVKVRVPNKAWEESETIPRKILNDTVQDFQFGYCLTCHSMQGSQVKKLLFIDENVSFFLDQQRWRYTGISRAEESLVVAK